MTQHYISLRNPHSPLRDGEKVAQHVSDELSYVSAKSIDDVLAEVPASVAAHVAIGLV